MASISKDSSFLLTHFNHLASERSTSLDQIPFIFGLINNPPALRHGLVELLVTTLNWNVKTVTLAESPYTIANSDAVLFVETSTGGAGSRELTLPAVVAGRVYIIKDVEGSASDNNITVSANGSDTIESGWSEVVLSSDYIAMVIIGGSGTEWHILGYM